MFKMLVHRSKKLLPAGALLALTMMFTTMPSASAQTDQGAITGVVQDDQGAVIPGAKVTLTATDTAFSLDQTANSSGVFVFAPVKIGNYKLAASAPSFETTVRENLHLDIQQRLNITLALKPGSVTQQVTVTTESPLLETQTSAVGQVISTETINNTPLNGRNWVYIAQLTAGVAPPFGNTRGSGTGDFVANGQSAEQNDFILDGVDNNTNLIDFLNGSSFVIRPPPDALAEFSLQTSDFSAEFGHSAGAVLSASINSRRRLGISSQYEARCDAMERDQPSTVSREPVRCDSWLSHLEEPLLLLRRHGGKSHLHRATGDFHGAHRTDAQWQFLRVPHSKPHEQ
jgi:hypothetical protein